MKWLINVLALLEALLCMTNRFLLIGLYLLLNKWKMTQKLVNRKN